MTDKRLATACALAVLVSVTARAATPAGFITGVSAGQPDSTGLIPSFNLVPNDSDTNLDIPVPQAILTHGLTYDYIVDVQTGSYSGPCQINYALTQIAAGKKKTLDSGKIANFTCAGGGSIYTYYIYSHPVANSPGPATLTGEVIFGTTKVTLSQTVYIQ